MWRRARTEASSLLWLERGFGDKFEICTFYSYSGWGAEGIHACEIAYTHGSACASWSENNFQEPALAPPPCSGGVVSIEGLHAHLAGSQQRIGYQASKLQGSIALYLPSTGIKRQATIPDFSCGSWAQAQVPVLLW